MARKYGAQAGEKVERAMREMKRGELRSGRSGTKVTSRKQAIAIGLSEARKAAAAKCRRADAPGAAYRRARPSSTRNRARRR